MASSSTNAPHVFGRSETLIFMSPTPGPSTTPALTANLVCRVLFGLLANLVCLVPLRLLHRNGEFAAVVFISVVEVENFETIVHSLIWRNEDLASWWPGYGLCDLNSFIHNFCRCLYITCLLAIIRNLAHQVGLLRANPLTVRERRRRNIIQALIMFPLPILQVALTWFLTNQRFVVGTLVGCNWVPFPSWPYLAFFILPPVIIALTTAGYAVLTYTRFRQLAKSTESALSRNHLVSVRAQRTKRRLYLMVVSILTPFLPLVITLAVLNVLTIDQYRPYSYKAIHESTIPYPWNTITFLRAKDMGFAYLNIAYISILSAVPIFLFFGTTKDAINDYRRILVFLRLSSIFPSLNQEYDPDRRAADSSFGSSQLDAITTTRNSKFRSLMSFNKLRTASTSSRSSTVGRQLQSLDHIASQGASASRRDLPATWAMHQQAPEEVDEDAPIQLPHRNPFLFRLNLDFPVPFRLPWSKKTRRPPPRLSRSSNPIEMGPIHHMTSATEWQPGNVSGSNNGNNNNNNNSSFVQARVWSDEEARLWGPDADLTSGQSAPGVFVETRLTRETQETTSTGEWR